MTARYLRSQIKWTHMRVVQTKNLQFYEFSITVILNTMHKELPHSQITISQDKGKVHEKS